MGTVQRYFPMRKVLVFRSLSMTHDRSKESDRCNSVTANIDIAATILDAALGKPTHNKGEEPTKV